MRTIMVVMFVLAAGAAGAEEPSISKPALWGSPTLDNGACCKTLGEVRDNIDRLD